MSRRRWFCCGGACLELILACTSHTGLNSLKCFTGKKKNKKNCCCCWNLGLLECPTCLFQVGFKDITVKSVIKSFGPSSFASVHFFFFFSVYSLLCFFLALFCATVLQHLLLSARCRSASLLKLLCGCSSAYFVANAPNRSRL